MRTGFSDKEAAIALRVHPRKVSQSLMPAVRKLAALWRIDPTRTLELIQSELCELDPMSDDELRLREAMLIGRADRPARRG